MSEYCTLWYNLIQFVSVAYLFSIYLFVVFFLLLLSLTKGFSLLFILFRCDNNLMSTFYFFFNYVCLFICCSNARLFIRFHLYSVMSLLLLNDKRESYPPAAISMVLYNDIHCFLFSTSFFLLYIFYSFIIRF